MLTGVVPPGSGTLVTQPFVVVTLLAALATRGVTTAAAVRLVPTSATRARRCITSPGDCERVHQDNELSAVRLRERSRDYAVAYGFSALVLAVDGCKATLMSQSPR